VANNNKVQDFDLYFNGELITFENGEQVLRRELITYESTQPDIYHTIIEGETLSHISWNFYKGLTDPLRAGLYWKYLADVNNILNPLDLTELVGTQIVIPNFNLARLNEGQ